MMDKKLHAQKDELCSCKEARVIEILTFQTPNDAKHFGPLFSLLQII